jgi:hypothetical protein
MHGYGYHPVAVMVLLCGQHSMPLVAPDAVCRPTVQVRDTAHPVARPWAVGPAGSRRPAVCPPCHHPLGTAVLLLLAPDTAAAADGSHAALGAAVGGAAAVGLLRSRAAVLLHGGGVGAWRPSPAVLCTQLVWYRGPGRTPGLAGVACSSQQLWAPWPRAVLVVWKPGDWQLWVVPEGDGDRTFQCVI